MIVWALLFISSVCVSGVNLSNGATTTTTAATTTVTTTTNNHNNKNNNKKLRSCKSLDVSLLDCSYPKHTECIYGVKYKGEQNYDTSSIHFVNLL